jgi:hypothetical protein
MKNILSIKNFFLSATQLHPLKRPKKGEKKSPTLSLSLSVKPEREKQAQGNFFTLSFYLFVITVIFRLNLVFLFSIFIQESH